MRGGREQLVEAREVVPGDILLLEAGDAVAADARLLEAGGAADRRGRAHRRVGAGRQGPSRRAPDTPLADRRNMVYAGTHVTAGRARAVVVATGRATEIGHIAALADGGRRAEDAARAPHRAVRSLADRRGAAALRRRAALGLLRGLPLGEMLMVAISQMVAMIPEGLPVAMTIALAVGVQRMARARRDRAPPVGGRDARLDDRDLQRQDRHADAQRDDGDRAVAARSAGSSTVTAPATPRTASCTRAMRPPTWAIPRCRPCWRRAALCNDAELLPPEGERSTWRRSAIRPRSRC